MGGDGSDICFGLTVLISTRFPRVEIFNDVALPVLFSGDINRS